MKENPVFKGVRIVIRTLLKGVMLVAIGIALLMASQAYNSYTSKAGLDPTNVVLLFAIPTVLFFLAFYAHYKLKPD